MQVVLSRLEVLTNAMVFINIFHFWEKGLTADGVVHLGNLINKIGLTCIRKNEVLPAVFGKNNPYCNSECKFESLIVFYSNVSVADIVKTIRSTDITRYAALELR